MTALNNLDPWYTKRLAERKSAGFRFDLESNGDEHTITVCKGDKEIGIARGILPEYAAGEALWMAGYWR